MFKVVRGSKNQNGSFESTELKHYGVKGMRWRVRKAYESTGNKSKKEVVKSSVSKSKATKEVIN